MSDELRSLELKNHNVPSLSLAAIAAVDIVDMIKKIDSTHRDYQDLMTLFETVDCAVCIVGVGCRNLEFKNSMEVPRELTDMITRFRAVLKDIESECERRINAIDMEDETWQKMGLSPSKGPEIHDMIEQVLKAGCEIAEFMTSIRSQELRPHNIQTRVDFEEKYSPKIYDATSGLEIKVDGLWYPYKLEGVFDSDVVVD